MHKEYKLIWKEEWIEVVKKAKRLSTSLIFLKRNYAIYKILLELTKIIEILIEFYNVIVKCNFYLIRWLDVVNTILDKGKGSIVGKLRIIQLIEANLQLLMRIFLKGKNVESIEKDIRISKYNFGLWKNYIIEEAILEKRLIYDCSIFNRKPTVYVITNLKVCYDK